MAERMISLGQFVNVGELLSTLVQTNPLEVEFNVPERYLGQLNMGQEIKTTSVAYPNEDFIGKVVFISPRLDEQDRTVLMKASIDNTDGRLKPGMFARLALVFEVRENALVVPEQAISYQGDQAMIIVMDGNGQAEFRDVIVGIRISGRAEILSGLEEGEIIVIEGIQKLGPGTPIEISEKSSRYGVERPGA
jgi:membrane fusion protein (multidrug efflux system)